MTCKHLSLKPAHKSIVTNRTPACSYLSRNRIVTLDTEVMGNNDEFGAYKVVKIPVYQKTEISKLIKPLQPHMLKATFCSEGEIHFPKEELKKKQTYLFSQTWIMTTRLESMFSFYNPHNMNCRTLGFCLLVYLLEGEKKRAKLCVC